MAEKTSRPTPPLTPFQHVVGLGALLLSFIANYYAGTLSAYQGARAAEAPDLLFRFLPYVDMRFFFVWGFAAFVALAIGAAAWRERDRFGEIAWSYALIITLRSFFIILTPMKLPAAAPPIEGYALFDALGILLTFEHDLFFSGHTAFPFVGYLVYRDAWVRRTFLGMSILLAATVLLTRLHYSIDVFGAFFITYGLHMLEGRWIGLRAIFSLRRARPKDAEVPDGLAEPA